MDGETRRWTASDVSAVNRLLGLARVGDAQARDRLIDVCFGEVEQLVDRLCGQRLRRSLDPRDLAQEVFLRVLRRIDALPDDATFNDFRGMLRRNSRWVALTRGRREGREAGESALGMSLERAALDRESGSETGVVTRADCRSWLRRHVGRLEANAAEVVRMRLEQKSFEVIARKLAINEAAARKRYTRACAELRARIAKKDDRV